MDGGAWWATVPGVTKSRTRLSDFIFTFHFHALEKEMATHSSILAWRIPGTGEPGGLPSMGSHRVGHDWSDLAAAARHCWATHRTKDLVNTRGELAADRPIIPRWKQGAGGAAARAVKGQTQPQRWHPLPNCEQAPSCQPSLSGILDRWQTPGGSAKRSAPQNRHTAHLRQHSHCRKPSSWDGGGDKDASHLRRVRSPSTWSP